MVNSIYIKNIRIQNFRCFDDYTIDFTNPTILVGINNSGKSTILIAIQACFHFLKILHKGRKKIRNGNSNSAFDSSFLKIPNLRDAWFNHKMRNNRKPIPIKFTMKLSNDREIEFHLSYYYGQPHIKIQNLNDEILQNEIYEILSSMPVLIPGFVGTLLEEDYATLATIDESIWFGRNTEVLRNALYRLQQKSYDDFKLISTLMKEYFNIKLSKIKFDETEDSTVETVFKHEFTELEIALEGSGFQQILQLLTFILSQKTHIILLDEPDAHLHPALQKTLIPILTKLGESKNIQYILSTHSKDIIMTADPMTIKYIDNTKNKSIQIDDMHLIEMINELGTIDSIDLALLLKTKKCLFLEGKSDSKILTEFASKLNISIFNGNNPVVQIIRNGHDNLRYYDDLTVFKKFIGDDLKAYSIIDRDRKNSADVSYITDQSRKHGITTHIWSSYHIENYLCITNLFMRVFNNKLDSTSKQIDEQTMNKILSEITDNIRNEITDTFDDNFYDLYQ